MSRQMMRRVAALAAGMALTAGMLAGVTTPASAATAPSVTTVVPGDRTLTVTWGATGDVGDDTVVYSASAWLAATGGSPQGTACTIDDTAATGNLTCTIGGLTNGVSYFVEVAVASTTGTPAPLRTGPYAAPRTVPGSPTNFTVTPGDATVTLTWQAPANSGGAAITGYSVTRTLPAPAVFGCATTVGVTANPLTCQITGLSNGTAYTFSLVANNVAGSSATPVTVTATPGVAPNPPTSVSATAGDTQATVTWLAPTVTGSSALSGYTVTASPGGRQCTTTAVGATPPPTTCTVTGLANGTLYTFTVTASNLTNTSVASQPSNSVTPVAPIVRSIAIEGARGEGADRNRVFVVGTSTNLVGQKVAPYYRLPGQRGFTAGTGIQTVDANGEFTWTRKTGKRIVVQFRFGDLRSNNAIIEAR